MKDSPKDPANGFPKKNIEKALERFAPKTPKEYRKKNQEDFANFFENFHGFNEEFSLKIF